VVFEFEKETKNTVKFKEVGDDAKIGTVYVPKSTMEANGIDKKKGFVMSIEAL
jgi:hypothetical protein